MTRKEQIKAILDEYAIFKGYYVKGGVGAERIYSGELADRIAALPLDEITAIQSHCKINMRIHRDYWLREELSDLVRGEHKGKYFAYKDISDGIQNGYFEPKTDE